jgi:restriction system protein
MRAWMTIRDFLDLTEEEVAIRSGLLLTDHDVFSLLDGTPIEPWAKRLRGDHQEEIGIRPVWFEDITRVLRTAIGNLPDATPPMLLSVRLLKKLNALGYDPGPVIKAFGEELRTGQYQVLGDEICQAVKKRTGAEDFLIDRVFLMFAEHSERSPRAFWLDPPRSWDGAIPLSNLFDAELVPDEPEQYLDQRFVDYLAAQSDDLTKMYWRNFERLAAMYFAPNNYEVHLGPGTKDGGVDLRIWPKGKTEGPPLLLVQCKRYSEGNLVAVEVVKALWADVEFEGATKGLIATTSAVTPEGKRLAEARRYPLMFAESQRVREWVGSTWRYSWRGKGKSERVGEYLLPPFLPIRPGDLDFLDNDEDRSEGT